MKVLSIFGTRSEAIKMAPVLSDSGGLQGEAPGLGVPVLVLRQVTERPEGVIAGMVQAILEYSENPGAG